MDPFEPKFTVDKLETAIEDLNGNLAQSWFNRGVIKLTQRNPGRGKKRLLSFNEALQVSLVNAMTRTNEPTRTAAPMAKAAALDFCDWVRDEDHDPNGPDTNYLVFTTTPDGHTTHEIVHKAYFRPDDLPPFFKVLDYQRLGLELYRSLVGHDSYWCDEDGLPLDPNHPWNKEGQDG